MCDVKPVILLVTGSTSMEGLDTETLRRSAPCWSLAGDKQLLDALQHLHEKIITRCQETNKRLDEMVTALDDASVHLQNVNNKFMALSNSQFIESRVYDDDVDLQTDTTLVKEEPPPPVSELAVLKLGVQAIEDTHESVTILASDSDTDSDGEDAYRVVLKPKDVYADRPLPYIIGSSAWKNKWHAGLLTDDSDSDSSTSRAGLKEPEQYSESEESLPGAPDATRVAAQNEMSISSTEESEREEDVKPTPSAVAAELARRLGGPAPQVRAEQPEYSPPTTAVKKVYRPEQPVTGTVFLDEPPPLGPDSESESEGDIFAELRRSAPVGGGQRNVADDLFGHQWPDTVEERKSKANLFDEETEPETVVEKAAQESGARALGSKKPVGGISLFGTNNSESIGAAILKRNQPRASSSDEEPQPERKEKNVFDDLFAKSEKIQKKNFAGNKKPEIVKKPDVVTEPAKKVDLFSDNIFDDIDDIFTTSVVTKSQKDAKEKSIFDEADDLFADIAVSNNKSNKAEIDSAKSNKNKSIFDSDDDLFNDNFRTESGKVNESGKVSGSEASKPKVNDIAKVNPIVKEKGLFEDGDDDLFSNIKTQVIKTPTEGGKNNNQTSKHLEERNDVFNDDNEINSKPTKDFSNQKTVLRVSDDKVNTIMNSPNLFDDDDDIFAKKPLTSPESVRIADVLDNITNRSPPPLSADGWGDESNDDDMNNENINFNVVRDGIKSDLIPKSVPVKTLENNSVNSKSAGNIFGDEPEDDIFKDVSATKTEEQKISDNHQRVDQNDGKISKDLFFENLTVSKLEDKPEKARNNSGLRDIAKSDENIFGNEEQLFKTTSPNPIVTEKPKVAKKPDSENIMIDISAQKPTNTVTLHEKDIENITKNTPHNADLGEQKSPSVSTHTKNIKPDIFSDIFNDQPPIFEKPTEPKKSKNINALFDDDSDDEALFFKKNDPLDDKPDEFSNEVGDDRLFGLFHDEPPALDVDFSQKPVKSDVPVGKTDSLGKFMKDDIFDTDNDDFLQKTTKSKTVEDVISVAAQKSGNILVNNDLFLKLSEKSIDKSITLVSENIFKTEIQSQKDTHSENIEKIREKENTDTIDNKIPETQLETNKIGKLKPMNFNINVNTLLPGASPKKNKIVEQTDGQTPSKNKEDPPSDDQETAESQLTKTVSFEEDPESIILDNKLSKERPKIQVKRRPSTRRARREAVKKSGIDFGEDSTDNSSSIDDTPKSKPITSKSKQADRVGTNIADIESQSIDETNDLKTKLEAEVRTRETSSKTSERAIDTKDKSDPLKDAANKTKETSEDEADTIATPTRDVKTKTVYILNDEDIFSLNTKKDASKTNSSPTFDDEDLFNNTKAETVATSAIKTLGNVYKESKPVDKSLILNANSDEDIFKSTSKLNKNDPAKVIEPKSKGKASIFDISDDDDELFNTKKNAHPKIKSIFGSDSEEELFAGKSKREAKPENVIEKKEIKKVEVKGSLFGDDDDDDLFGTATKKVAEPKQLTSKPAQSVSQSARETSKPAEPVIEDPLSLFGADDD